MMPAGKFASFRRVGMAWLDLDKQEQVREQQGHLPNGMLHARLRPAHQTNIEFSDNLMVCSSPTHLSVA
jgi:hypothetical protein